jgi:hypothetical protein
MRQGYHVRVRYVLLFVLVACGESSALPDAAGSADSGDPLGTCDRPCRTTALSAMFAATRTLDLAFFGINSDDNTLRIEAYRGAGNGCPTMNSPPPDYTLVVARVPMPTSIAPLESPANMLDFKGDLLGGALGVSATTKVITPVAYTPGTFVAVDVMLTFQSGSVTGHLYATHCNSLDQ